MYYATCILYCALFGIGLGKLLTRKSAILRDGIVGILGTPWLHEDGVQIFLIYVGPNVFRWCSEDLWKLPVWKLHHLLPSSIRIFLIPPPANFGLVVEAITAHAPFCKAFDSAVGAVATEVAGMTACCPVRQVVAIVSLCFFVSCRKDTACLFLLNFAPWKKHMDKEDRDFALEFLHCTCSLASKKNCNTVESSIFGWSRMVPGNIFPLESVNKPISFDLDDLILVCRQQRLFESILTSEIQQTSMRSSTKTTHISTKLFYVSVLAETRRRMSNWRSLYIFSKDV